MNLSTSPLNMYVDNNINPIGQSKSRDVKTLETLFKEKHIVETIERFKWSNLPGELPQDLIERILFFRGKGTFFKGVDDKLRFLPFTLDGTIDLYGRYISIIPVLFTGQNKDDNDKYYFNTDKSLKVCYDLDDLEDCDAVILNDRTLKMSQDVIPMNTLINPIIEQMVEILVLINIDLISSAKVYTIIAKDEAQKQSIENEFDSIDRKILAGKRAIVVTSMDQLQELKGTNDSKDSNRYFQTYQSFENLRKDIIGQPNSGTFMKNSIQTDDEVAQNSQEGSPVLMNALRQRKDAVEMVNKMWGYNISVDISPEFLNEGEDKVVGASSNNSDRNDGTLEEDE